MTNPKSGLTKQTSSWGDLKAAYRLCNEDDVTYVKLQEPHIKTTQKRASQLNKKMWVKTRIKIRGLSRVFCRKILMKNITIKS
jgi:hypothetical protein